MSSQPGEGEEAIRRITRGLCLAAARRSDPVGRPAARVRGPCVFGLAGLGVPGAQKWGIAAGLVGIGAVSGAVAMFRRRVEAGPDGLRFRAVLGWRRLAWDEIVRFEDLRVASSDGRIKEQNLRVAVALRDGTSVALPVPWAGSDGVRGFEQDLSRLRAVHARYKRSAVGA